MTEINLRLYLTQILQEDCICHISSVNVATLKNLLDSFRNIGWCESILKTGPFSNQLLLPWQQREEVEITVQG
uniref:Uncharacterized protein n=1 Tax=Terrapene triunguis TaxID=2587831 RepID=A0A674JAW2_9SAUR